MRTDEAAAELGVSKTVVWRQIRAGRLPATKYGRDWLIRREDFEQFRQVKRDRGRPRKSAPPAFSYPEPSEHRATGRLLHAAER